MVNAIRKRNKNGDFLNIRDTLFLSDIGATSTNLNPPTSSKLISIPKSGALGLGYVLAIINSVRPHLPAFIEGASLE